MLSLDHFKNLYCEPETGPHARADPEWEWDTYNSEIEDQHMGGGGEVYIGGGQQHWFGGNFNNCRCHTDHQLGMGQHGRFRD